MRSATPTGTPPSPAALKTRGAAKHGKPPSARLRSQGAGTAALMFTGDRWKASITVDWGCRDSHPHLCDDCKARALETEHQAKRAEYERQAREQQNQDQVVPEQKASGWLPCFRTGSG
ncbi:hypothetical protein ACIOTI_43215 [Streptomyces sp. NPDC087843]|uniref:hypothetical protein n=1 Tax=Streptomyces sp. NPDC087843 TaxID=3365804 RepID=UPI00381EB34B